MTDELRSLLVGTIGLDVAAAAALWLTLARPGLAGASTQWREGTARLTAGAILLQVAHVAEELATGFHERFPRLLGLAPWPVEAFLALNLGWLAIWGLAVPALRAGRRWPLFPLWFLAVAGLANLLAHPLLALAAGGYFPGLLTAPLVGGVGLALVLRLWAANRS